MGWDTSAIGDLTGRRALVTGATSGIGTETARELLRHGAEVVITARDDRKAAATVAELGDVEVVTLDLADLPGTIAAAQGVVDAGRGFDIVVNNAGVMIPPFTRTMDGFELQIATNHLGHFAWNATLWPLLREGGTRIVTVSSLAHSMTKGIDLRSLEPKGDPRRYKKWRSYAESKLANLLYTKELDRRVKAAGLDVVSVAAHPGLSSTNLTKPGGIALHSLSTAFTQPARAGAWPSLRAATDPELTGGEYLGPDGFRQTRGRPRLVGMTPAARDPELAAEVWSASETATGVVFDVA
ncbi:SDR family NAD(P)-dependent oxidoreductase [Aeromicrobium senzhongii]|uniref:SDR family NAD(P)-dependent oxidoreductase n=1 Tax=Aeromicrobium senzhongii TaxID=2663859 RepID=A0ABX6SS37_9ACTN|nr:oxidoreductase [Aeromicrobium senzhongii]MTB89658.1 SDR family NAD(P)-dependent oxidoreductase [Aeromicrobium senzhongii]QNL94216.1 SDR family NAD(P)-dependent oxidoreductase [Aeromicrobium senzhongii]